MRIVAYDFNLCLIGTSSIFIHFQDWLIRSHLRFYRKRYCVREATICIFCTHRMCPWRRGRSNKSSYLEKLCSMLIMEGQPREVRGNSYQSRGITVIGLYIYIRWCRCCLNNYRYWATTYCLTLACHLYIVIEGTCCSWRRNIGRGILSYWSSSSIGSGGGLVPLIAERATSFGYYTQWCHSIFLAIGSSYRRCCDSGLLVNGHPYWNGTFLFTTIVLNHTIVIGNTCWCGRRGIGISRHPCGRTSMYNRRGIFEPLIGHSWACSHYLEGVKNSLSFTIGSIGRLLGNSHRRFYRYRDDITYWGCTSSIVGYLHKVIGDSLLIRFRGIRGLSSA